MTELEIVGQYVNTQAIQDNQPAIIQKIEDSKRA